MATLIKRYANRKLYNTASSRYITLKGIAELIDAGEEVRVIDNETGEDITSVALSQILVDTERSNTGIPRSLLSQILERGGDVLYGALRQRLDEASDNLGEIQDRVRRIVGAADGNSRRQESEREGEFSEDRARHEGSGADTEGRESDGRRFSDWIAYASPDFDTLVQGAVERVFKLLDLPRRSDVEALNHNLARVADAVETLERAFARREEEAPPSDPTEDPAAEGAFQTPD